MTADTFIQSLIHAVHVRPPVAPPAANARAYPRLVSRSSSSASLCAARKSGVLIEHRHLFLDQTALCC